MNFRRLPLLFALALVAFALPARAQLGVYGTVTVNQISTGGTQVEPIGGFGGAYYDFKSYGPIRLGADLRAGATTTKQGAQAGFNNVGTRINMILGGVRGTVHTPIPWVKPYVQGSVGWGSSNFGQGTTVSSGGLNIQQNKLYNGIAYQAFGGLDLTVFPLMDVRLVEVGIGALNGNGSSHTLKTLGVGFVFHLP